MKRKKGFKYAVVNEKNAYFCDFRINGIMCHPYKMMIGIGTPNVEAVVAIACELLRIIHALVRDNTVLTINQGKSEFCETGDNR